MLSGDNSILQKATDAKQTSEKAEAKEQAQMDIMAYIADKTANHQDASLDDAKIKEILSDNKSYVKEANDTSFITSKGGYTILYSELYNSSKTNTTTVEDINSKIGTAVTGYSAKDATWRVFYADENETFLFADYIDELIDYNIPIDGYSGIEDLTNSSYCTKWNSKWLTQYIDAYDIEPDSAKAIAFLCEPSNWSEYSVGSANYAIGGPTLELLVASLNQNQGIDIQLTNDDFNSGGITWDYVRNFPNFEDTCGGMYAYGATSEYYIATPWPSSYGVCEMAFGQLDLGGLNTGAIAVRPIVSIPTSKISVNGNVVTVLP